MNTTNIGFSFLVCLSLIAFSTSSLMAQGGLPPGVTPDGLQNDIFTQIETETGNAGGVGGNNAGGGGGDGGGAVGDPGLEFQPIDIPVNQDQRSQRGFVGVSLEDSDSILPEYRFV